MPELPEVQTIVDDLNKKVIGRRITGVWFDVPKIISIILGADKRGTIRGTTQKQEELKQFFEGQIKGLKIIDVKRRGKNILIYLINPKSEARNSKPRSRTSSLWGRQIQNSKFKIQKFLLLIHQKLTGHLLIGKWRIIRVKSQKPASYQNEVFGAGPKVKSLIKGPLQEKVNNYIRLIFYLDNGWQLALSDLRKFAKVLFGPKEEIENLPDLKKIGPEPLDASFKFIKFAKLIKSERRRIKQVLMDQEVIAGIGNIYSDEILWQAKIHPFIPANKLKANKLRSLYLAMRQILQKAVKLRGASTSDYRDTEGKPGRYAEVRDVYQREGEPCERCQTLIKRVKIGGRSSHYCPKCQK
jgi:formamidopyrimidine-DNA glycosylase